MTGGFRPRGDAIGTGESHSVRELCETTFCEADTHLGWEGGGTAEVCRDGASGIVRGMVDPRDFRPAEVDFLLADPSAALRELGSQPRVAFHDLVHLMVRSDLELMGVPG